MFRPFQNGKRPFLDRKKLFVHCSPILNFTNNYISTYNRFTELPEAVNVSALQRLQSLSLSGNLVSSLGNLRMPSLWRLEVSDNRLTNLTSTNLMGLPGLQVLDLSNNKIASIEKAAFGLNRPLKALRLDSNR